MFPVVERDYRALFSRMVAATLILCAVACGNASDHGHYSDERAVQESEDAWSGDGDADDTRDGEAAQIQRIRRAQLRMEVEDLAKANQDIRAILTQYHATLDNEELQNNTWQKQYAFIIRVPAESLDALLDALQNVAKNVDSFNIQTDDVTRAAMDMDIRLRNLRAAEARYVTLLERADSIQDVLAVQAQIDDTRTRIEQIDAERKEMANRVRRSTVLCTFYQNMPGSSAEKTSFGKELVEAASYGVNAFKSAILVLVGLWPFLLVGGAITAWIVVRKRRRTP